MLSSLPSLRVHLGIEDDSENVLLTQLLQQADALVKGWLKQNVESRSYTEYYSGDGTNRLVLRQRPITAITGIWEDPAGFFGTPDDAFDADSTALIDGQEFSADWGKDGECLSGIVFRIGNVWPDIRRRHRDTLTPHYGRALGNVKVTYTAGWAGVPADITLATNMVVAYLRKNRTGAGIVTSESFIDYSYTVTLPPQGQGDLVTVSGAGAILRKYRRVQL